MPEIPNKIDLALKEMDFCPELKVTVANGKIVKVCKGRYSCVERNGIIKEFEIREDITV